MEISTSQQPTQGAERHAEVAYDAIAPVYDDFTAHHEYDLWVGMLLELGAAHGLRGDTALDVACGTGKSFLPMIDKGWRVTACDLSASMVELARAKAGPGVRIEVADMRELPTYGSFDLVCCLDDAINYLHSQEEVERTLRGLAANLAPEGILIFDSNALAVYNGFFSEHVEVEMNGRRMIWDGRTGGAMGPGGIAEAAFEVEPLTPGTGPTIEPELHRQRHHPEAELREAIEAAGLELVGLYGHHFDGVPHDPFDEAEHNKGIYVARLRR
jgi:SAM-dependent methyltransferase